MTNPDLRCTRCGRILRNPVRIGGHAKSAGFKVPRTHVLAAS